MVSVYTCTLLLLCYRQKSTTLHYITLHYITLHYITLHYAEWITMLMSEEWMNVSTGRPTSECVPLNPRDATIHTMNLEPRRENGYGEIHISSLSDAVACSLCRALCAPPALRAAER